MPDRKRQTRDERPEELRPWAGYDTPYRDPREASGLTAAVQVLDDFNTRNLVIPPTEWQREAWAFYHTLGELNFAIGTWLANCMSRVRLVAAVKRVGEDDPSPVVEGPVAQLVAGLGGGLGGQAAIMRRVAVHLSVPGDSYLVGEDTDAGRRWTVYSSDEIRIRSRGAGSARPRPASPLWDGPEPTVTYEINTYRNEWRALADNSLVVRCWQPDEQYGWAPNSVCQAALPILREVDFYNRYIVAVLLSRLALNGLLLVPSEVTFPAKPQYKDAADPFIAELLDVATRSIKNPGTAGAALPLPIKVPGAWIEKFKHLTFETTMGKEVMENRTRALERLAVTVNIPTEVITGMKDMNHWGQWQLEESSVKIYIAPLAEIIVRCFTEGYLQPMLRAAGLPLVADDGGQYVVWYDASQLTQQPDRGTEAQAVYDRGELSPLALRRESGFEEADAPTTEQFKDMALRKIAMTGGADALQALAALTGDQSLLSPPPPAPAPGPPQPGAGEGPAGGAPTPTPDAPPAGPRPPATQQSPGTTVKAPPATRPTEPTPVG